MTVPFAQPYHWRPLKKSSQVFYEVPKGLSKINTKMQRNQRSNGKKNTGAKSKGKSVGPSANWMRRSSNLENHSENSSSSTQDEPLFNKNKNRVSHMKEMPSDTELPNVLDTIMEGMNNIGQIPAPRSFATCKKSKSVVVPLPVEWKVNFVPKDNKNKGTLFNKVHEAGRVMFKNIKTTMQQRAHMNAGPLKKPKNLSQTVKTPLRQKVLATTKKRKLAPERICDNTENKSTSKKFEDALQQKDVLNKKRKLTQKKSSSKCAKIKELVEKERRQQLEAKQLLEEKRLVEAQKLQLIAEQQKWEEKQQQELALKKKGPVSNKRKLTRKKGSSNSMKTKGQSKRELEEREKRMKEQLLEEKRLVEEQKRQLNAEKLKWEERKKLDEEKRQRDEKLILEEKKLLEEKRQFNEDRLNLQRLENPELILRKKPKYRRIRQLNSDSEDDNSDIAGDSHLSADNVDSRLSAVVFGDSHFSADIAGDSRLSAIIAGDGRLSADIPGDSRQSAYVPGDSHQSAYDPGDSWQSADIPGHSCQSPDLADIPTVSYHSKDIPTDYSTNIHPSDYQASDIHTATCSVKDTKSSIAVIDLEDEPQCSSAQSSKPNNIEVVTIDDSDDEIAVIHQVKTYTLEKLFRKKTYEPASSKQFKHGSKDVAKEFLKAMNNSVPSPIVAAACGSTSTAANQIGESVPLSSSNENNQTNSPSLPESSVNQVCYLCLQKSSKTCAKCNKLMCSAEFCKIQHGYSCSYV